MRISKASIAVLLVLLLSACPAASKVPVYLNMVAEGASAVVSVLASSGAISQATADVVLAYAKQASALVIDINKELASSHTDAQKWTVIAGEFAAVVVPNIPNAPPNLSVTIGILDSALVLLEGALATQLGGSPPARAPRPTRDPVPGAISAGVYSPPPPHGRSIKDAVSTAKKTLDSVQAGATGAQGPTGPAHHK